MGVGRVRISEQVELEDLDRWFGFACAQMIMAYDVDRERAAIFQALGRYDESLVLREEAVKRRASFEHVAALVGLHAERGDIEAAEQQYEQSRSAYRGVSPIPLALLDFQLGLMWMNTDRRRTNRELEGRADLGQEVQRRRESRVEPHLRPRFRANARFTSAGGG